MKRTRSNQAPGKPSKDAHINNGQAIMDAERSYYNCRARLLHELGDITPQDTALHDRVNASVQELITLGLNYRHVAAGHSTQTGGRRRT